MLKPRPQFLSLVLLSAIGCTGAPSAPLADLSGAGTPVVQADPWNAATPTQMTLRFENPSTVSYILAPGIRILERLDQGGWQPVDESGRAASDLALELVAGQTFNSSTDIPRTLSAGTYRFRYSMGPTAGDGGRLDVVSNSFEHP